ncbi:Hypothetical protein SRAE_2000145100 [Strongyloides ratti]|uniref:Uncharacterized protein n=1 Tax=Strongyloides ratti TaxID=34506 RepID=A0A090LH38_STRRB|nr:Hypothetical protein SRAE_2000145100 [Strongyloides ratti]CEF66785.1 Hypothetical protein SRAE_2000145100 [Strongyloides ratti]
MPSIKKHTKIQEKNHENQINDPSFYLEEKVIKKLDNVVITNRRQSQRIEDMTYYKKLGEEYYNLYLEIITEKEKRNKIEMSFIEESTNKMIEIINNKISVIEKYNNHEKESNVFSKLDDNSFVDYEFPLQLTKEKMLKIHDMFILDYNKTIVTFNNHLENLKFDEDVIGSEYWQIIQKRLNELTISIDEERKQLEKEKLELEESISTLNIKIEKEEIRQLAKKKVLESQKLKLLEELNNLSSHN